MEAVHGITRLALPGSTLKRGEKVNVYWCGDGGGILVDTGWDTPESLAALQAGLPRPPRHVLVTHLHPDHGGAAARVAAWSGAEVWLPREDLFLAEHPVPPGARYFEAEAPVNLSGVAVRVLHTPGHTPGHRCFVFEASGALLTGDMVLGEGSTWVGPPHGDMAHYMQSLERLRHAGHRFLCPGHGAIQEDPLAKIDAFLAHRRMRENQVLAALAEGVAAPAAIVARNYQDTPPYLHPLAETVVRAHLAKLVAEGRVVARENDEYGIA
jgi:glyoxylase-like metal-dependent hydrolase (beta-lactamase superfamily II)